MTLPPHRPLRPSLLHSLVVALGCATVAMSGCAFTESATEVTFGRGHLPALKAHLAFPSLDQLMGDALPDPATGAPLAGLPTTLEHTTLAHLQGLMAMSGACERVHREAVVPGDDPDEDSGLSDLEVAMIHCPAGDRCQAWCGGHEGMILRFGVNMQFVGKESVQDLQKQLTTDVRDAIAQVRLQIADLSPIAVYQGQSTNILSALDAFDVDLMDDQGHRLELLRREHIELFAHGGSTRVEFAPDSAFTHRVLELLQAVKEVNIRVLVRIEVEQPALYAWQLAGSSLHIEAQPEVVISTFSLVTSGL